MAANSTRCALCEMRRVFDHIGRCWCFREIRDPNDQRAASLFLQQRSGSASVIGLARFASNVRKRFNQAADVLGSPTGSNGLLDGAAVGEQAHAVAILRANLRNRERRINRIIELGELERAAALLDLSAKQAACVHHNPDSLAAFGSVAACDQLMPPRRGRPGDVAKLVSFAVFAQALEFACRCQAGGAVASPFRICRLRIRYSA